MRKRAANLLPSACFALFLSALWSCGSDSGSPTKPDPDPDPDPDPPLSHAWTPGVVGLPPADSAVLDSAAARYRSLRMSGDPYTARTTLVAALNAGWEGVAVAGVTVDGTTIQINFSDGVNAVITTDELFQTVEGGEAVGIPMSSLGSSGFVTPEWGPVECASVGRVHADTGCGDAVVPSDHKVRIVNPATATNGNAAGIRTQLEHGLTGLGWDDLDIDVRESSGRSDRTFTPQDVLDQTGAGQIVFVSESAMVSLDPTSPSSGQNTAYAMQLFNGGKHGEYGEHIPTEDWSQYEEWQQEGKLIHGKTWSSSDQVMADQVFILEDALATEITLEEGAMVHFISPHSGTKSNLEGMVNTGGAASATGWDGLVKPEPAAAAVLTLVEGMVGSEGSPKGQAETLSDMKERGQDHIVHSHGESRLEMVTLEDRSVFLPAYLKFDAPFNCLAPTTLFYDVDVTYPECPELNQNFHFFPGGTHSLTGLPPMGAEISYQAKDVDGTVLGAGIYDLSLGGGPNDVDLCPCFGRVDVDFSGVASVPGVDAGAQLQLQVSYADSNIPTATMTKDVWAMGDQEGWDAIPGQASVAHTLIDGEGNVLAYGEAEEFDLRCDASATSNLCFGWLELTVGQVPPETSSMVVSATSDQAWIERSEVTVLPGAEENLGGLLVGDNVHVAAEARSAAGEVLSVLEFDRVIECGPNEVTLNFPTYGLVLFTEFTPAPASGIYGPLVSGLVRAWQEGDTLVPTGKALAGVEVHLRTDRGGFRIGLNPAEPQVTKTTNEWGWVSTYLVSSSLGTATVSAYADEPELEADPVTVEFKTPVKVMIDDSGDRHDSISYADTARYIHQYCVIYQKWNNGRLISEDSYPGRGPLLYGYTGHHVVGDEVRFVWKPGTGCTADPDYSQPFISGAYLHYFFGEDYDHQVTNLITGQKNPLTQTVDYTTTLTNPLGPPPSPFDLAASERYVLSGFRQF